MVDQHFPSASTCWTEKQIACASHQSSKKRLCCDVSLPDVVVGIVMVVIEDGGRQAEKLQFLPQGLVVVEGVELHG